MAGITPHTSSRLETVSKTLRPREREPKLTLTPITREIAGEF
jgi:hypothetical protein